MLATLWGVLVVPVAAAAGAEAAGTPAAAADQGDLLAGEVWRVPNGVLAPSGSKVARLDGALSVVAWPDERRDSLPGSARLALSWVAFSRLELQLTAAHRPTAPESATTELAFRLRVGLKLRGRARVAAWFGVYHWSENEQFLDQVGFAPGASVTFCEDPACRGAISLGGQVNVVERVESFLGNYLTGLATVNASIIHPLTPAVSIFALADDTAAFMGPDTSGSGLAGRLTAVLGVHLQTHEQASRWVGRLALDVAAWVVSTQRRDPAQNVALIGSALSAAWP